MKLTFAFLLGTFLIATSAFSADAKRPNILWLTAEDMGPDSVGCYGAPQTSTPNLDKLAAEGVRYTRAYTTAPVCSASRSAFMTGMYQTSIGAHHQRSHRDDGYKLPDGGGHGTTPFGSVPGISSNFSPRRVLQLIESAIV